MPRFAALLGLVVVALSPPSFAQEKEDYLALNRKAIDALHAKKWDDGIAILTHMLDVGAKEQRKGTAYNFACVYALKGDAEKAFEWLDKSIEWGWGTGRSSLIGPTSRPASLARSGGAGCGDAARWGRTQQPDRVGRGDDRPVGGDHLGPVERAGGVVGDVVNRSARERARGVRLHDRGVRHGMRGAAIVHDAPDDLQ